MHTVCIAIMHILVKSNIWPSPENCYYPPTSLLCVIQDITDFNEPNIFSMIYSYTIVV